jgi:hypothetical protein
MPEWVARDFLDEPVEAFFRVEPSLSKKPGAPSGFRWRGQEYAVMEVISEWFDYRRRGRMARNMAPAHAAAAERKGSWGVGRNYFRVKVGDGRAFDLYFDRAPESAGDREGHWFVWRELSDLTPGPLA